MSEHTGHESAHAPAAHGHAGHDEHEHIHEANHYIRIWGVLVLLFFISVAGPMVGIKWLTLITAFGIAVVKASMVVKYFMHLGLKDEKRFVHYFLATSLAFMFLFFFAVAPDVMKHEGTQWINIAAKKHIEDVNAAAEAGGGEHGEHGAAHGEPAHTPETPTPGH